MAHDTGQEENFKLFPARFPGCPFGFQILIFPDPGKLPALGSPASVTFPI
jgi:hypothetical protein